VAWQGQKKENMSEKSEFAIMEIEAGILECCPECGCTQFLQCELKTAKPMGGSVSRKGLKCFDCGIIFLAKTK
jgi:hypothetical protein